ncbi:MAG TPA: hypothetical protein VIM12_08890 [Noviherbaspirillum sp.]|jgi:hypothetical protein|uniref:hypothetical protein n=1 Tax=Noviherbaspirillum sp. TaxID=1926288 RepID=UPI002F943A75
MKRTFPVNADGLAVLLIVLYVALLAALPAYLPTDTVMALFSETGPFEMLSIATWILAALTVLVAFRATSAGRGPLLTSLLFLMFAMREADWHKKFTADSLLKSNYYRHADAPMAEKVLALIAALVFIGLVAYVGIVILRFLFLRRGWRSRGGAWLLAGALLVVFGKVLDRAPAELALAGHAIGPALKLYASAFEEGLEMIHPLIVAWAFWLCRSKPLFGLVRDPRYGGLIHR